MWDTELMAKVNASAVFSFYGTLVNSKEKKKQKKKFNTLIPNP